MADSNSASEDIVEKYDVLPKMIQYLDRHLIFPLLEDREDTTENKKLKAALLKGTNMFDYLGKLDAEIKGLSQPAKEYAQKRDEAIAKRDQLAQQTEKLRGLLEDEAVVSNFRSDKVANLKYLETEHGVTSDMVNALYDFGNFQYSCGEYVQAADLLYQFRVLSTDNDKVASATWGKLASDILSTEWETAMEEITKVKELIDTRLFNNPLAQLQHRTWLLHWALFPFFNYEGARDTLTDLFFSPAYINTIQTLCPWLLRYLTAAVVTGRSRTKNSNTYQKQLKDLTKIVNQEGYEYSDPLTQFIKALNIDFDFEEAQKKLGEAEQILAEDFFLRNLTDTFVDSARHLISESYCKIHQRIDIKDLSTRLNLSQAEGEKWIVNLIRDTRVDAKIDYQQGTVVMNHPPQSVYQQVIEKTKGGFFRTTVMYAAVGKS
ncbi:eukaryotic translation initiation factor 3 subunit E [Verruconis gallopava]|uniref:Eukaryotic translation initiation factor 3 subunit E n=1 Tax=Verruconis gallopava TaxID=253628 RepID=A0A0D2AUH9_9PEZI|nr:eukaryotic translation initiation factor 3 subunit E [Verruconis gallopava]KIW02804.1 eukaryotic translation initiation factor 3 subunit E [Verruconis gallopava]